MRVVIEVFFLVAGMFALCLAGLFLRRRREAPINLVGAAACSLAGVGLVVVGIVF
jgi:LPXTG-motif cell wall-anchored protein